MAHSFRKNLSRLNTRARDLAASAVCTTMLLASGAAIGQQEFTDRIKNAKALDSTTLRTNVNTGANNVGAIITTVLMIIGFFVFAWGVWWVMRASRSEGRTPAAPGYWMVIGGGLLGGGAAVYAFVVGAFTGMTS